MVEKSIYETLFEMCELYMVMQFLIFSCVKKSKKVVICHAILQFSINHKLICTLLIKIFGASITVIIARYHNPANPALFYWPFTRHG